MPEQFVTTINELRQLVGRELGVGQWLMVDQERINAFADAMGDHQWIHVDVERAAKGPFGGTIAHGFLTLSLSFALQESMEGVRLDIPHRMSINYGLNRVRFPAPVHSGKRIRGRSKLLSVEDVTPDAYQLVREITVEIEGEAKPAMVAEHVTRLYV